MLLAARLTGSFLALASLVSASPAQIEGRPDASIAADARFAIALDGFVLEADGAPAAGAVVTSSAGGRAVADSHGRYELEIEVPADAVTLELTALGAGGGSRRARLAVAVPASSGRAPVGPLLLSLGSQCEPAWFPTFGGGPGTYGRVYALAVYDDGAGPALYVAGDFVTAGGQQSNRIGRWDGASWTLLGSGLNAPVYALAVHDDGGGPALFAGGSFTSAGGAPASRIARWDGATWTALGTGLDAPVHALEVHDDGSGPALYAGGEFASAGGAPASRVARWDGASWSALPGAIGDGVSGGGVRALASWDDGGGPTLVAGGSFTSAGGVAASHLARWNGSSWGALGAGTNGSVLSLAVDDDGVRPALYVGGVFSEAGGAPASRIARWDGAVWAPLGSGLNQWPSGGLAADALAMHDDGGGPALYAGGQFDSAGSAFARNVARWDGSSWSALGAGPTLERVRALAELDGVLYVGGDQGLQRWESPSWTSPALGHGLDAGVADVATFDDGGGPALYAGGAFTRIGALAARSIAKWDGAWSGLGGTMNGDVEALAVFDSGGGPALYAAGNFSSIGAMPANQIARWNGTSWSGVGGGFPCGSGCFARVHDLEVYDDGGGPDLYASGSFVLASAGANRIARWDGTSWSALGSGLSSGNFTAHCMAVYDDGSGPALYVSGGFQSAGALTVNGIARWNGTSWSPLGGLSGPLGGGGVGNAMVVHDDGSGPALYVGGSFTFAGAVEVGNVARWDGTSWSALAGGTNGIVRALATHDDGNGPALYAGGSFSAAGGVAASRIARWDGAAWSPVGAGTSPDVHVLAALDDGHGPALYAGGNFTSAYDSGDSFLARFGDDVTPPVLAPRPVFAADPLGSPPGEIVLFAVTATDDSDESPDVVCVPPSGSFFPRGTTLVTCTATDACGNEATSQFPVTVVQKVRER